MLFSLFLSLCLSSSSLSTKKKEGKYKTRAQPVTTATCLSWIPQSSGEVGEMDERREVGKGEEKGGRLAARGIGR